MTRTVVTVVLCSMIALSGCGDDDTRDEGILGGIEDDSADTRPPTLRDAIVTSTALPSGYRLLNRGTAAMVPGQGPFCPGHHPAAAVGATEAHQAIFGRQPDGPWATQLVGDWDTPERASRLVAAVAAAVQACGRLGATIDGESTQLTATPTTVDVAADEVYAVSLAGEGGVTGVLAYARVGSVIVQAGHLGRQGVDPADTTAIISAMVERARPFGA